ncbi:MAG: RusA family crossover junction endodeoxyribonuclease [Hamadaea sp.]|nr:RusA family crossover junction endodeoxyribonuclease [Hamadaea sp.]
MGGLLLGTVKVHGVPAPQGSKNAFRNQYTGRIQQVESSKKVKPWRADVRAAAEGLCLSTPLDEPLLLDMVFTFMRPKGHYGSGRNAGVVRASAPSRPHGKPDLSKLARSTEDALTSAGVYRDDARIVEYGRLAKVWAGEDPDALDRPGALIRIYRLEP